VSRNNKSKLHSRRNYEHIYMDVKLGLLHTRKTTRLCWGFLRIGYLG